MEQVFCLFKGQVFLEARDELVVEDGQFFFWCIHYVDSGERELFNVRYESFRIEALLHTYVLVMRLVSGIFDAADDIRGIMVADFITWKYSFEVDLIQAADDVIDQLCPLSCCFGDVLFQPKVVKGIHILYEQFCVCF